MQGPRRITKRPDSRSAPRGGEATAESILDAAEHLFADRGYAGTTLRDVAAAVGIRNPSIYNHFRNKSALYEAVVARAAGPVVKELWDREDDVEAILAHLARHRHLCRLFLKETLSGEAPVRPIEDSIKAVVAHTRTWLQTTRGANAVDDVRVTLAVLAIYHVVAGFYATDAFYTAVTGRTPHAKRTREAQIEIVRRVGAALFAPDLLAPAVKR
jgi:AcrR family transcriptional regulator